MTENNTNKELFSNIYWVGSGITFHGLSFNTYLLIDQDQAVLIDPGPAFEFSTVFSNVSRIIQVSRIKYVILHNSSSTVCASLSLWEQKGLKAELIVHERAEVNIKAYGITSNYFPIDEDKNKIKLKSGRVLNFLATPYLPYVDSFITLDSVSGILFSSFLFGATPRKWKLFADRVFYKESMKSFHETLIPDKQFLTTLVDYLVKMNISLIAPFTGSVINDRPSRYFKILQNHECGVFFNPLKYSITRKEGYINICNKLLDKFYKRFDTVEVANIFHNTKLMIDPKTGKISDFEGGGEELWQEFFLSIYTKKGIRWLIPLQSDVEELIKKYNLVKPSVFTETENEIVKLDAQNIKLKEINERLERTRDKLTRCPVTKLRNEAFCVNYLSDEIVEHQKESKNFVLLLIGIDKLSDLRIKFKEKGKEVVEKTLKTTAYILEQLKNRTETNFKFSDNLFAVFIPDTDLKPAYEKAEDIRNTIADSELYFEKITVTVSLSELNEINYEEQDANEIINIAKEKLKNAEEIGENHVFVEHYEKPEYEQKNILLVETDIMILEILSLNLQELSYNVLTCDNGFDAIKLINKHSPDLVISELMLPKHNAFVIRENMLENSNQKNVPFVLLSHQKDEQTINQALKLGITHYLKKPVILTELIGLIENVLHI